MHLGKKDITGAYAGHPMGMANQHGKFLPQFTERDKPLRDSLSKKNSWRWDIDP